MTLTYKANLYEVKVNHEAKYPQERSFQSKVVIRAQRETRVGYNQTINTTNKVVCDDISGVGSSTKMKVIKFDARESNLMLNQPKSALVRLPPDATSVFNKETACTWSSGWRKWSLITQTITTTLLTVADFAVRRQNEARLTIARIRTNTVAALLLASTVEHVTFIHVCQSIARQPHAVKLYSAFMKSRTPKMNLVNIQNST